MIRVETSQRDGSRASRNALFGRFCIRDVKDTKDKGKAPRIETRGFVLGGRLVFSQPLKCLHLYLKH
jgi:hypothetical protein